MNRNQSLPAILALGSVLILSVGATVFLSVPLKAYLGVDPVYFCCVALGLISLPAGREIGQLLRRRTDSRPN